LRGYDPDVLGDEAIVGALIRAMMLRADLATAARDAPTARRWGAAAATLWSNADPELQLVVQLSLRHASM
jgi:hypothetical protein